MTTKQSFCSVLAPIAIDYLAHARALGRAYATEEHVLRYLDTFLAHVHSDLTSESFALWCHTGNHLSSGVQRNRMRIVRNLCLYRRRTDPTCFLPDLSQFPAPHQVIRPHIFTDTEILAVLAAAEGLTSNGGSPLHREVFRLAIVLLYTTGLRRGELLRLTVGDYEPYEHTLVVRESKFHKSRLLPLSSDGYHELDAYLQARRARELPTSPETPLLWNRNRGGNGYTGTGIWMGIRALFRTAGIRTAAGRLPRVHDLRHNFGVQALLRWYRAGVDVQAKLPFLAAYMGHVSVISTEYYLHFIEEIAACASERFAKHCGGLIVGHCGDAGGAS